MIRFAPLVVTLALIAWSRDAEAQDFSAIRVENAIRDQASAQRQQAESLRRIEAIQRDQARRVDNDRHNAERDGRSMRRFDR
ncbi:hypothetical protein [Methylobacterium sp. Leaf466]|uniref:hypothetical protein n=1 Tax=Methylobacterium sp. Leaf466 TaxID=1736386 RepID=UPI0006F6BC26|nr:hypothetical protein [Methylobacterium sp. Leaf466]KQT81083.1 hypothetical protein ASG59_19400 [Methylobacterium sp. Leaf466]